MNLATRDMKDIYTQMGCYEDEWPAILVTESTNDKNYEITRYRMPTGESDIICIPNSENVFEDLCDEFFNPKAEVRVAESFMYHGLSSKEISCWYSVACVLSDLLGIDCPQILFSSFLDGNAGCFTGEGLIAFPDYRLDTDLMKMEGFVSMAHELYHEFQFQHGLITERFVYETEEDLERYCSDDIEIQAEAFARLMVKKVFGINLFKGSNKKFIRDLKRSSQKIKIDINEDTKEFLRVIIEYPYQYAC